MVSSSWMYEWPIDCRDNLDREDIEYPPPQPLDGEIDRIMETDNHDDFILRSDNALQDNETVIMAIRHPAPEPAKAMPRTSDLKTRRRKRKKMLRSLWMNNLMEKKKSRGKKMKRCKMLMLLPMKIPRCKVSRIIGLQFSLLERLHNWFA